MTVLAFCMTPPWGAQVRTETVDDPEMLDLVELEVRELLKTYGFPGDDVPVVRVSALAVSRQSSRKRPFTKNARRPSAIESGSAGASSW